MKRLTLLALNADRDNIYDALVRLNCVQLKRSADIDSFVDTDQSQARENVLADVSRVEEAIAYVGDVTDKYNSAHKKETKVVIAKNSFARPRTEIDFD